MSLDRKVGGIFSPPSELLFWKFISVLVELTNVVNLTNSQTIYSCVELYRYSFFISFERENTILNQKLKKKLCDGSVRCVATFFIVFNEFFKKISKSFKIPWFDQMLDIAVVATVHKTPLVLICNYKFIRGN